MGGAPRCSAISAIVPNLSGPLSENGYGSPNVIRPYRLTNKDPHRLPANSKRKLGSISSLSSTALPMSSSQSSGRTAREYPPLPSGVKTRDRPARSNGLAGTTSSGLSCTIIWSSEVTETPLPTGVMFLATGVEAGAVVAVEVAVGLGSGVGNGVGVAVAVGVITGVGGGVGVSAGTGVSATVGVGVCVGTGVSVGVAVAIGSGVSIGAVVGFGVGTNEEVGIAVGTADGVAVDAGMVMRATVGSGSSLHAASARTDVSARATISKRRSLRLVIGSITTSLCRVFNRPAMAGSGKSRGRLR